MRESLREFIYREAGPDEARRRDLIRHLAPSILVAGGYDFNELRQLIQYGPGWNDSFGSEYVSATWPETPVVDPLPCITIRPFTPDGYTTTPYELVMLLAFHLRDVLVGAEPAPDFDGIIRFGYIEPESIASWMEAAQCWRTSRGDGTSQTTTGTNPAPASAVRVNTTKGQRRDILTPVIEHAQSLCKHPLDTSEVWGQLHKLAGVQYLVLLHIEGNAIAYTDGDDTKHLTRKKLANRLKRQQGRPARQGALTLSKAP